jgi:16S rRNA (guanine527-N7)-methyltransferase
VTSRAFASLADFHRLDRELAAPGGIWLAMKGKLPLEEIAELPAGFQAFHVERLEVPGMDAERCLVWIRRTARTLGRNESGRLQ